MYFIAFRVLTPKIVQARKLLPGAAKGTQGCQQRRGDHAKSEDTQE